MTEIIAVDILLEKEQQTQLKVLQKLLSDQCNRLDIKNSFKNIVKLPFMSIKTDHRNIRKDILKDILVLKPYFCYWFSLLDFYIHENEIRIGLSYSDPLKNVFKETFEKFGTISMGGYTPIILTEEPPSKITSFLQQVPNVPLYFQTIHRNFRLFFTTDISTRSEYHYIQIFPEGLRWIKASTQDNLDCHLMIQRSQTGNTIAVSVETSETDAVKMFDIKTKKKIFDSASASSDKPTASLLDKFQTTTKLTDTQTEDNEKSAENENNSLNDKTILENN